MTRSTSMARFSPILNPGGISKQELMQFPALFASAPSPKMSERYTFLSTAEIIEPLLREGYVVTHVSQRATRHGHRDPRFTRHCVRLRDSNRKPVLGGIYPEVVISNSHDGQSRYTMHGGILRLDCLNGLTTSLLNFPGLSLFHRGELEPMLQAIRDGVEKAGEAIHVVEKMMSRKLNTASQRNFAKKAATLVWDTVDFDIALLLKARREADEGDDLWRVYNRVQENLIRGGVEIQHTVGQARSATTRGITNLRRSLDLNLDLWQLAARQVTN